MRNNIQRIIEDKGLKVAFVIHEVGLAKSSFYEIMKGNSIPSLANARKISKVLDTSLDEVFPNDFNKKEEP